MLQLTLPLRQAPRILQSSRLLCLYLTCRIGRPYEYLKAPGSYASTRPAASAGPTNTSKLQALMPQLTLPLWQAIRILQSSRFICLYLPCRSGRPHEYSKAPDSYASTYPAASAGHTNTPKLQAHMPLLTLPLRQATRIPQSSWLICLYSACRSGRPHEYFKVPGSYASTYPVAPAGHTNTPKLQALMPLLSLPLWQASRILQSSRLLCLNLPCRSGRPHEYFKVPGSYASTYPAASAGHTNTSKLLALMPLSDMPLRQATRILQSSSLICLNLPCRTGRPHEYSKAPDSYASTYPAAPEGHTNTPKLQTRMPLLSLPLRQATRILQSSWLLCLNLPCRSGRPHEYFKVPGSYASTYPASQGRPITLLLTPPYGPLLPHLSSRPG